MNPTRFIASALACLALGGCVMLDIGNVPQQQRKIDSACRIDGSVRTEAQRDDPRSIVVVLARLTGADAQRRDSWQVADHFVLEQAGRWVFSAGAGTYGIVAFEDANANLRYESGEPFLRMNPAKLIVCKAGEAFKDIALVIPADGRPREEGDIDVAALQARPPADQMQATLGEVTAVGEIAAMDDPRFTDEVGVIGLWRPFDFVFEYRPGIYFLEPYDPKKIPVLFVHGITGHPANFRTIVAHLDRSRYQPFMYFYPSGGHLGLIADHLTQTMMKLEARYGFRKFYVIAHSMGGLTARGFILRHNELAPSVSIPLFVSLSTPWGGHKGATYGVKMSPAVVRVWYDMAPDSEYLRSLYYKDPETIKVPRTLAPKTAHHLMFSFRRSGSVTMGEADDDTVTVSSQLIWDAQRDAVHLYGFNETHMSILDSPEATELINGIMDKAGRE
jgi:pimeloyl-ACP methyl ester carboxylesterase